jgi:hypothetical protein
MSELADSTEAAAPAPADAGDVRVGDNIAPRYGSDADADQPAANAAEHTEPADADPVDQAWAEGYRAAIEGPETEWPDAFEMEPEEVGGEQWQSWAEANPDAAAQRVADTFGVPVEHVNEAAHWIEQGVPVEQVAQGLEWLRSQQAAVDATNAAALGRELDRLEAQHGPFGEKPDEREAVRNDLMRHAAFVKEADPEAFERVGAQYVLDQAARLTAEQLAEGNANVVDLAGRVSRYMPQSNPALTAQLAHHLYPEALAQAAMDGVDDPEQAAVASSIHQAARLVNNGAVRVGDRVSDRYAELHHIYEERATPAPAAEPRAVRVGERIVDRDQDKESAA